MNLLWIKRTRTCLLLLPLCWGQVGCGKSTIEPNAVSQKPVVVQQPTTRAGNDVQESNTEPSSSPASPAKPAFRAPFSETPPAVREKPRILGDLLNESERQPTPSPPPRVIDDARLAAAGVRKVVGKHLVLYTDLPTSPAVDEIPRVFDLAVPQWCEYFHVDPSKVADWRLTGFVMKEKATFQGLGLLPADLPPFLHGYQRDTDLWVYEQPSDYYRRHLVLHEGTHGFMMTFLHGAGPPWYAEGMAERMGTHLWKDGQLTMGYIPPDKEAAPHWGRIKLITDDFRAGNARTLISAMKSDARSFLQPEPYAWSWAVTTFFERHPLTAASFPQLIAKTGDATEEFSKSFYEDFKPQWPELSEDWQLFVIEADYGYDFARSAVVRQPADTAPGTTATIVADRSWQSTGFAIQAGKEYSISASGRYQIANQEQIWWCEPGGVTIHYHNDVPLGTLMAAVRPDDWDGNGITPLAESLPIGLGGTFDFATSGTLYLRINEPSAGLHDNAGQIVVQIQ